MKYYLFLLCLFYGIYYVCAYIHTNQWIMINNLLKKGSYRKPLENILYNNHHYWCRKYTKDFIKKYNFIVNKHQVDDLQCYASIGLLKSIRNLWQKDPFELSQCDENSQISVTLTNLIIQSMNLTIYYKYTIYFLFHIRPIGFDCRQN